MSDPISHQDLVLEIQILIGQYNAVAFDDNLVGDEVLAGRIDRDRYGLKQSRYDALMNTSGAILVKHKYILVHHPDLSRYLVELAFHRNKQAGVTNFLENLRFTEVEKNETFSDVSICFTPNVPTAALFTYRCSMPRSPILSDKTVMKSVVDQLRYCHAAK